MADDPGYNEFGFTSQLTGMPTLFETPNLDALAQRSVVARQGYSAAPICSPSRAGLLTGRYQQRFGFDYNLNPINPVPNEPGLPASELTIAERLKALGYTTGLVGKWHVGFEQGVNLPMDQGFDEFYGILGGGRSYFTDWGYGRVMRKGLQDYEAQYRIEGNPADYDPVRGRYVTDAFGDEAADFVNRHAAEEQPFFLYLPVTAPHDPGDAKQQDMAHLSHISDPGWRTKAAMTYAMDRAVGKVLDALEQNGIDDETIVVFVSDNGGTEFADKGPFAGRKGLTWEGGIRSPFMIHVPGLAAGVYNAPVIGQDILPTVYAAAGGDAASLNVDGVNLLPYLSGANTSDPHQALFWRTNNIWAVRKGDWKLGNFDGSGAPPRLHNLATDPGEATDLAAQNPQIVADLLRELTHWEATLDKPIWGIIAANNFDHFVFQGVSTFSLWHTPNNWKDAATGQAATMNRADSYPNTILEFQTRDSSNYFASNFLTRMTQQTYMLNEIRFTGNFTGTTGRSGKVQDNALLLVKNLSGQNPRLRLDATSSGTNARFQFLLFNELQLHDDFEITGDGTQEFLIAGNIRDYDGPRSVTKTGTSQVVLAGNNTFRGSLNVLGGEVKLTASNPVTVPIGAITGAAGIYVGSGGTFSMDSGLVSVPIIDRSSGGGFQFTGGELRVTDFIGDLTNQGGSYSPGASAGVNTISGNYSQSAGKLIMEAASATAGSGYDVLSVSGTTQLGGTLQFKLLNGYWPAPGENFEFLRSTGGISGTFAATDFPHVPGRSWRLEYEPNSLRLFVEAGPASLPGDYNGDGVVNAADYVVWRNSVGAAFNHAADGDQNGVVDQNDYLLWRSRFGTIAASATGTAASTVPEPAGATLALLAILAGCCRRSRRV